MVIIQKTFTEKKSILYLVSTPIGNMSDISLRALQILKKVEVIFSEDTRISRKLLKFYDLKTPLISFYEHNEKKRIKEILLLLGKGKDLALICDAGTPLISDPGLFLVQEVKKAGFHVTTVPGASAFLSAFILSSFELPFCFLGFLPKKKQKKESFLKKYRFFEGSIIIYETSKRLLDTLFLITKIYKKRNISISRELTKKFETIINGDIDEILKQDFILKGEYVLVIEKNKSSYLELELSLEEHIDFFLKQGFSEKESFTKVAKYRKIPKKEIYKKYKILNK
ncbi:16S rRNA (cytidine(1402)-2'-O)-methyltransferase [Texas Phoenix palm phytoplasma]|uniref:Ribosomal RNA small subunit methyltransferase I n=1 Tax=Texas Phoenix palm phytoplasma TaxID=176709 RepID=A0ABS5BIH6_9MOLU|nr:16S rRNA (cytidine(1402)-2'-O)-methyltransferase [Texas Phoenix palm phytoplasma]MBP3059385.1 16S rRNA (cytidine(1402)-2'-O)-methyltransferase [Texas Phoenix palm phytoplasma]